VGEQGDVEPQRVGPLLVGGERVDQHGGQSGVPQPLGDDLVSRAAPAASVAVGEHHHPVHRLGNADLAVEDGVTCGDP
jgi:hypothetical protein